LLQSTWETQVDILLRNGKKEKKNKRKKERKEKRQFIQVGALQGL